MSTFWERIPTEKRGQVYHDLAQLYGELCGEKLEEPEGLRGESKQPPITINAPDYEEETEIELDKEVRKPPKRQAKVK